MPSPSELLSRGFSFGGKNKNAKLASIAAGLNASGRYSRRGNNRRANEAKAQAMLKYFTNSEKKAEKTGKNFTDKFQTRRNFARNLAAALAVSPSGSRASSRGSSRSSSRSSRGLPVLAAAGAGANKAKRTYTRKSRAAPPASGTWPLLKKSRQLWTVKVVPSVSRGKATVSKLTGKEGGKLLASSHNVTVGKAGRSVLQQALHEAEGAFENKVADGYTEVRSVHRGTNNELKSINNFVPS